MGNGGEKWGKSHINGNKNLISGVKWCKIALTSGTAKFSSPLGTYDFIKRSSIIEYGEANLRAVADDIVTFAEADGLDMKKIKFITVNMLLLLILYPLCSCGGNVTVPLGVIIYIYKDNSNSFTADELKHLRITSNGIVVGDSHWFGIAVH